jgi:glucose-1-phosphate adenylyltransferase
MLHTHRVMTYDFAGHAVPGIQPDEEPAYWRDVGTIDAWFDAQFDTLGPHPLLRLANPDWPIHSQADELGEALVDGAEIDGSLLGAGAIVQGAQVAQSILRAGVHVQPRARLTRCVVMEGSTIGEGAQLRGTVVCEDNDVPPQERIGEDAACDAARFPVTAAGIVVVPPGHFPCRWRHPELRPHARTARAMLAAPSKANAAVALTP